MENTKTKGTLSLHIAICDDNAADRRQLERLLGRESEKRARDTGVFILIPTEIPMRPCSLPSFMMPFLSIWYLIPRTELPWLSAFWQPVWLSLLSSVSLLLITEGLCLRKPVFPVRRKSFSTSAIWTSL